MHQKFVFYLFLLMWQVFKYKLLSIYSSKYVYTNGSQSPSEQEMTKMKKKIVKQV